MEHESTLVGMNIAWVTILGAERINLYDIYVDEYCCQTKNCICFDVNSNIMINILCIYCDPIVTYATAIKWLNTAGNLIYICIYIYNGTICAFIILYLIMSGEDA